MNISVNPFDVFVKEEYLYDGDITRKGKYKSGKVVGVSTYVDFPITFHVLIEGAYLYSDLPITALVHKPNEVLYSLQTLSHVLCKKYEIDCYHLEAFDTKEVAVYFKAMKEWIHGKYMMSFDFYTDNELVHLIKMNDGNFCLAPNHKINWNNETKLSDYKKNHIVFSF